MHSELCAVWQHRYGEVAYPIDLQFASGAGGLFTVHGPTIGRNNALVSTGVAVLWNERLLRTFTTTDNWAATITTATTSAADCASVSEKAFGNRLGETT